MKNSFSINLYSRINKKYLFFYSALILVSCQKNLSNTQWVYANGGYLGRDVLDFKNKFYCIKGDNLIYRVDRDSLVGKILKINWHTLDIETSSGEKGTYRYLDQY